jgi:hypothetical protein
MPYEDPYRPPDSQDSRSGTAVAPALDVGEEEDLGEVPRRKNKGKRKA